MTHSSRFNNAITKLYAAFTNGQLEPECCNQCAVGHILDGRDMWKHFAQAHGSTTLTYVGKVHEMLGRTFGGYTPSQLLAIEATFLKGCGYKLPLHFTTKPLFTTIEIQDQFNGLCAVVSLLCELDHINDVMSYTKLFDTAKNRRILAPL